MYSWTRVVSETQWWQSVGGVAEDVRAKGMWQPVDVTACGLQGNDESSSKTKVGKERTQERGEKVDRVWWSYDYALLIWACFWLNF